MPRREEQEQKGERGDRDHPDCIEQPADRPARWQGPRDRDQCVQRVLVREAAQAQRQPRHQEQPADPVLRAPGSKDKARYRDGHVHYLRGDVGDGPAGHAGRHQLPVQVCQRHPAADQRYRACRGAPGHPLGRLGSHLDSLAPTRAVSLGSVTPSLTNRTLYPHRSGSVTAPVFSAFQQHLQLIPGAGQLGAMREKHLGTAPHKQAAEGLLGDLEIGGEPLGRAHEPPAHHADAVPDE